MIFRKLASWLAMAALSAPALAGSNLPLVTQSGQTRQLPSGTTLAVQPSTTGAASIHVPQGTAPTSPTDGDCWSATSGYFCQINGTVVNFTLANLGSPNGTLGVTNGGTGATTAANARTNLGLGTAATQNTGASGANVPLLNGVNSWSGAQTYSALENPQASIAAGSLTSLLTNGTLTYTSIQNSGPSGQVGGNYAALQFSNDASTAFYGCFKNRQTTKGTGGTAVQPGDDICELQGSGWDGSGYNVSGTLDFAVDDTVSAGIVPTNYSVWLGSSTSSGVSGNTLAFLLDSRSNAYFRNGNVGIGTAFGYTPPATYSSGTAPTFPLSISKSATGTYVGAYYAGSSGGGAEIRASNGFSSTVPVYGFWFNNTTGIGNPASNIASVVINGSEALRVDASSNLVVAGTTAYARTTLNGSIAHQPPVYTASASYSVGSNDYTVIFTSASTVTVTMPSASAANGRILKFKTIGGAAINSGASNISPLAGGAAGTAILAATAGKWAELQSDGTNWVILEGN